MPNCTAYAYGRAYEILGKKPNLSRWSAEYWYDDNIEAGAFDYGQNPRLGAIACWYYNGGGGHVAVVEKIENGIITFSNSAWGGAEFYLTTASVNDSNAGGSSWWNFQGYIYILDGEDYVTEPAKPLEPGVYQTELSGVLNMRSGAGTDYSVVTTIGTGVQLNITEIKTVSGVNWGKTVFKNKTGWVCMDFCKYISELPEETVAPTTQPTTAKPTTQPTTAKPTTQPTTAKPTTQPTTAKPTTQPTTVKPTTQPTTVKPTTQPTTVKPTTQPATTKPATKGLGVGDVNADGKIDIVDATCIQKIVAGLGDFTDEQKSWADFNFDGRVNISDVTGLQKYLTYRVVKK